MFAAYVRMLLPVSFIYLIRLTRIYYLNFSDLFCLSDIESLFCYTVLLCYAHLFSYFTEYFDENINVLNVFSVLYVILTKSPLSRMRAVLSCSATFSSHIQRSGLRVIESMVVLRRCWG